MSSQVPKNNFEKILLERRSDLLSKTNKNSASVDIDLDGDDTDEIQGKILAHIESQISFREKQRLASIEKALSKIRNGSFGTCEECEDVIGEKRLLANPEFTICVGCAESFEHEAKMRRIRG